MLLLRCGSLIVDVALNFKSTVRESAVLFMLQNTAKNKTLGEFNVSAIVGTRPISVRTEAETKPSSSSRGKLFSDSLTQTVFFSEAKEIFLKKTLLYTLFCYSSSDERWLSVELHHIRNYSRQPCSYHRASCSLHRVAAEER